ncbi:MAG TPA: hypothetical protein VJN43_12285 [Bryobacteraceae bacterium]|nr:hypothetical protein [Bryobacteraceae bacterium]
MITKHWITLVVATLALSSATLAVVWYIPAIYRAEALVLVDSQKIPEKYVAPSVASDLQDRLATISQQILSSTTLKKVIDDFDLYHEEKKTHVQEEIIEMMRSDIKITLEKGWTGNRPGAFRIAYQGRVPTTVAEVANRIANLFINENLRTRETQAEGTAEFLQSQLNQAQKQLIETEARVAKYKVEHNGELPEQEASLNFTLQRLETELQGNQDAINRAQQTKVILENSLGMAESAQAALVRAINQPASVDPADPAAPALVTKPAVKTSEALQQQLDQMRARYGDDYPDMKRLREEIARLKKLEAQQTAMAPSPSDATKTAVRVSRPAVSPEVMKELSQERDKSANLALQLKALNRELETRAADHKRIVETINIYQKRIEQIPVRQQEMEAITRDYQNAQAEYQTLLKDKSSAEMATEMERREKAERFTLLDSARVPEIPFKPNRPVLAGLGVMLSLAAGIAMAVGKEFKKSCFLGEWELPEHVTAIGRVPYIHFTAAANPAEPRRRWKLALVSSAVISLIGVLAVGVYFAWKRF